MDLLRVYRHLIAPQPGLKKLFDQEAMLRIQAVIIAGEATHRAEVRLLIESALPLRKVLRGMNTRQRALDLFGTTRAWDTEENNGVLLYVNFADRHLEVIADRGAARSGGIQHWLFALGLAQEQFRQGDFEQGVIVALEAIHRGLALTFPAGRRPA
jgi:uncharacterized membrane protein